MTLLKGLIESLTPKWIDRRRRVLQLSGAVFDALHDLGGDGEDCEVLVTRVQYPRVPRWMRSRQHEIWHVTIHGWRPKKEAWAKYPGVVATRIHSLLAQKGFVARVTLKKDRSSTIRRRV